jgi:diguanylate cyclase
MPDEPRMSANLLQFDARPEAGLASANRALRMLSACNAALIRIDDEERLLNEICRIVVEIGGYRLAGVGYALDDEERSLQPMAAAGDHPENVRAMRLSWSEDSPWGLGPAGQCVRSGKAVAYPDLRDQAQGFPWREAALRSGYQGAIALPLRSDTRVFGFIGLFSSRARDLEESELGLLQDLADNVAFGVGAIRAEKERRKIAGELAFHASHEAVTGLERYSVLERRLEQAIADPAQLTALLLIDLDRFKAINESMGHALADDVLRTVGERLNGFASEAVAVAHLAGDEFIVTLSGGDEPEALALAERIRCAISQPIDSSSCRLLLTCTIGISHSPAHGSTMIDLLRRAQAAMERGKLQGRDCVHLFLTEQMQDIEDRITLGGRLREAARLGELQLHYQPQFSADLSRLNGFEALLRWTNKELGPVSPGRFIPIAEALGLMPEIGVWVLREACRQARAWLDAGHSGFNIAINVSAQQLQRPGLVEAVSQAIAEFAIPADVLDIELTESSLMENVARLQGTLRDLKALGVMMSLDDFGTGYSSLAYLKHFPLDKLKIDQSFVRGLPENADDAAIARTIVSIGHQLRLLVSAEGVETQEQAEFLREIGCDELQGYFLGRPAAPESSERFLVTASSEAETATPL